MNRIMIAGTGSGCGKTTVTCALLQAMKDRGLEVSSFKCGPDYIDPMFHKKIIGITSHNLDSMFCDKNTINYLLKKYSAEYSVIEGVMGYYDGVGDNYSSCNIALDTKTPTVIVVDCKGMSRSIGAVITGFLTFSKNNIKGFIFNRLPESLSEDVRKLCEEMETIYLGRLPFDADCSIESRHLGLVSDGDQYKIKEKMKKLSLLAERNINIDKFINISKQAGEIGNADLYIDKFIDKKIRVAVSEDDAFCFSYEENLDLLRELGCETVKFSPLRDDHLPQNISGLILSGGYPEIYCEELFANRTLMNEIRDKINSGLPTAAECGGFIYLHQNVESAEGKLFKGVGVIGGKAYKTPRLQRFGYVDLHAKNDGLFCGKGEILKAHEFHYWDSTNVGEGFSAVKVSRKLSYDCIHSSMNLYAGFPHLYFYSDPTMAENFVKRCVEWKEKN